ALSAPSRSRRQKAFRVLASSATASINAETSSSGESARPRYASCSSVADFDSHAWAEAGMGSLLSLFRFDGFELDIGHPAVDALDLAHVDALFDVSRGRIDLDRSARAFQLDALHGGDERVAVGLALGLAQCFVD